MAIKKNTSVGTSNQPEKKTSEKKSYKKATVLVRLSSYEEEILEKLTRFLQMSKSEVIRHLIHLENARLAAHERYENTREF